MAIINIVAVAAGHDMRREDRHRRAAAHQQHQQWQQRHPPPSYADVTQVVAESRDSKLSNNIFWIYNQTMVITHLKLTNFESEPPLERSECPLSAFAIV